MHNRLSDSHSNFIEKKGICPNTPFPPYTSTVFPFSPTPRWQGKDGHTQPRIQASIFSAVTRATENATHSLCDFTQQKRDSARRMTSFVFLVMILVQPPTAKVWLSEYSFRIICCALYFSIPCNYSSIPLFPGKQKRYSVKVKEQNGCQSSHATNWQRKTADFGVFFLHTLTIYQMRQFSKFSLLPALALVKTVFDRKKEIGKKR